MSLSLSTFRTIDFVGPFACITQLQHKCHGCTHTHTHTKEERKKNDIVIYNMVYCDMQIYVSEYMLVLLCVFLCPNDALRRIFKCDSCPYQRHVHISHIYSTENIHKIAINYYTHLISFQFIYSCLTNLLIFSLFHYLNQNGRKTNVRARFLNLILTICLQRLLLFVNTSRHFHQNVILTFVFHGLL